MATRFGLLVLVLQSASLSPIQFSVAHALRRNGGRQVRSSAAYRKHHQVFHHYKGKLPCGNTLGNSGTNEEEVESGSAQHHIHRTLFMTSLPAIARRAFQNQICLLFPTAPS